jgi:hypothetical protein
MSCSIELEQSLVDSFFFYQLQVILLLNQSQRKAITLKQREFVYKQLKILGHS